MHYVYILRSETGKKYIGYSNDLKNRIYSHSLKRVTTTKTYEEPKLIWYCAFVSKKKALAFEKYLKQGSGHAFMNKRLI